MKIHLPTKVLIATTLAIASTASFVCAETALTTGEILKITGPDDLQLDPDAVVIAVDVFGDEDREVNGVLFQTDKTDDNTVGFAERGSVTMDLKSTHFIDGWVATPPEFTGADATSAENLAAIMQDIRWSQAPNPLTVDVSGLEAGNVYQLQLLMNENADRDRRWDISVNGELVADDISSEGTGEGDDFWEPDNSFVYMGDFEANNEGKLSVIMQQHIGGQDQLGSDNNPILQAVVVNSRKPREIFLDFNTDPAGTFEVVNNAGEPAEWRATGGVDDSGYFSVTDNVNGTSNVLIFDDITEGLALRGFDFTIDLRVGGGTDRPADGFSLNLVTPQDPLLQEPVGSGFAGTLDLGATEENLPEEGSQTGLGVGLDAWESGGSDIVGFSIRVDGILVTQVAAGTLNGEPDDETSLQTGPQNLDDPDDPTANLTWQQFRAFLDADTSEMTIQWKGETLLDKEVVPWTPTAVRPIFAARTGGANQNHHIDNLRLVMIPARLASLGARVRNTDLVITATNGPESNFDPSTLVVTVDGAPVTVGDGVVDGARTVFTYTPNPPFEPETTHPWVVTGSDNLGNEFRAEGAFVIAPTNIFSGGFFTTRHVWTDGEQIGDREVTQAALDGELGLQGDITVRHPWVHFHDNAAAPIDGLLSVPYPLWAEVDQIADENILTGERIGGGLGDRNDFAIESTGEFFIRNGGNILFVVNSDDGFVLEIDGDEIGEAGNRGRGNTVMEKQLEAGTHTLRLTHWERGGGAGVSLYVSRAPDLGGVDDVPVNKDNFEILSGFNIHDVSTEDTDGDGMDDFKETFFFGDLSRDGSSDFDEDGLTDALELANRADPTVKDSDGDGLEDGPEINVHKTDPAQVDTDGDSIADGVEVNDLKTDPTKKDTDDDTFGDNIEIALGNDPLSPDDKPDAIIAVAPGLWSDPATWSDGQVPSPGKKYVAVGTVTKKLVSAAGTFGGDSLTLIGPGLTLDIDHGGDAVINLTLNNANASVKRNASLSGGLDLRGTVHIGVGGNALTLNSAVSGGANLTFQGGSETDAQGNIELTSEDNTFGGPIHIIGTDVAALGDGSLGQGSIRLASGGIAYGYDSSSDISLMKIQGDNFRLVLGGTIQVADILGVDPDGGTLFSLNDLAGPGPYTADDLLAAFQLDEGISGEGTIELLGTAADTDGDGLRDSWETENFGNLDAGPDGDPDGDGLTNLHEQSGGTDPNVSDSGGAPPAVTRLIVQYDFNEGAGTVINNAAPGGAAGTLVNAHAGAWVATGGVAGSGYLNFTQDGANGNEAQHILTGIGGLDVPNEGEDDDYTMMAWTRFETATPGGDSEDNMIFGQLSDGNVLHNGARADQYHMGHWGNDISGGTMVPGEWHHVAWRYKDGIEAIFVDGVEVISEAKGNLTDPAEIVIGATRSDQDRDFSGDLDDVRIYDGALSEIKIAEIAAFRKPRDPGNFNPYLEIGPLTGIADLDIEGDFTHAVNIGGTIEDYQVGDINFAIDTPGPDNIEFQAVNHIEDWGAANDFGPDSDNTNLANVVHDIRWSGRPDGVLVTLKDVQPGGQRLQLLFGEKCCDRAFAVRINGELLQLLAGESPLQTEDVVLDVFSPNEQQGGDHGGALGAYIVYEFVQETAGDIVIDLNGTDVPNPDGNAILSGVSLEYLGPIGGNTLGDGLLGYWRLDEGAGDSAGDGSGNGNNGAIVSADGVWVEDPERGTVYQSGNGSYIDFGTILPVIDVAKDFTWSFWVNAAETDNNNIVLGNRWSPDGTDFAPREFIKFTPRVFEWHFNDAGENMPGDNTLFVVGEWAHNLVVKSGETLTYYRNGVEVATSTVSGAPANPQPLYLGGQNGAENFSGLFDEVAIFDRALSPAEVTLAYELTRDGIALVEGGDGGGGGEVPAFLGQVFPSAGGGVRFEIPDGATVDIEFSTDLINWDTIATGATGSFEDTDAARAALGAGYYRGK